MSEKFNNSATDIDLNSPNSISRALKPEYWDIAEEDYRVNPENLPYADPDKYAARLYNFKAAPLNKKFSLSYYDDHIDPRQQRLVNVAVTPLEYNLILRSLNPRALGNIAISRTLTAQPLDNPDDRFAAGERAAIYAYENKLGAMIDYREGSIIPDIKKINRLIEATKYPGLARGREMRMRLDMGWILNHVIEDMFSALKSQKNWTDEQQDLARTTTFRRIFFETEDNQHITYFRNLMGVNRSWLLRKQALVNDRVNSINRIIND